MKINRLIIVNLGPYVNKNVFDFKTTKKKNIVLFGGKNGAGKTSLFTAIKLCLYGCKSMGYDNKCTKYNKEIIKFINDNVKYNDVYTGSVTLDIDINNGHEVDKYILCRKWEFNKGLDEEVEVTKNNEQLNDEAKYDFEKYILSIIPPDVFDLYFFDGEKIVDYFLDSEGNKNLKTAIMCISGFNIFNIMIENFDRVQNDNNKENINYKEYQENKKEYFKIVKEKCKLNELIESLLQENKDIESKLKEITKKYTSLGGIDKNEWDKILLQIQKEEEKRSENNSRIKVEANESLPFLLLGSLLKKLEKQINKEENNKQYNYFVEVFNSIINSHKYNIDKKIINKMIEDAEKDFKSNNASLHNMSIDATRNVIVNINNIKSKDIDMFKKLISENNESLKLTSRLKEKLENCSNDSVSKYVEKKEMYLKQKEDIINNIDKANNEMNIIEKRYDEISKKYLKKKDEVENEIKGASINDISIKSLLMLESLENELYEGQISKIKNEFSKNIKSLMRKADFINDIDIDDNFRITAYKNDTLSSSEIINILMNTNNSLYVKKILNNFKVKNIDKCVQLLKNKKSKITIPVIADFTKISNGEKQVFIMALYQSIISLSKTQVPFIIDTPFARTDTEHREKISQNFFPNLDGQVIILSTDEEINRKYQKLMNEHIAKTYLLTNEGKSTFVFEDKYF